MIDLVGRGHLREAFKLVFSNPMESNGVTWAPF